MSGVKDMHGMFLYASVYGDTPTVEGRNLCPANIPGYNYDGQLLDLSSTANWDVSKVEDMSYMFENSELTSVDFAKNWNVSSVKDISYMFYDTSNLSDASALENWNISSDTIMNRAFSSGVITPSWYTGI